MIDPEEAAAERARLRQQQAGADLRIDDRRRLLARLRSDRDTVARIAADEGLHEAVVRAAIARQLEADGASSTVTELEAAVGSGMSTSARNGDRPPATARSGQVGSAGVRLAAAAVPSRQSAGAHVCMRPTGAPPSRGPGR